MVPLWPTCVWQRSKSAVVGVDLGSRGGDGTCLLNHSFVVANRGPYGWLPGCYECADG